MIKDLNTHKQFDNKTFSFIVEYNKRNKMDLKSICKELDKLTKGIDNFSFSNMTNLLINGKITITYFQRYISNTGYIIMNSKILENEKINIFDYMGRLAILINKELGI